MKKKKKKRKSDDLLENTEDDYHGDVGIHELYGSFGSNGIAISIEWLISEHNKEIANEILSLQ